MPSASDIGFFFHRPKYDLAHETTTGIQIPVKTSGQQEREMRRFAGACRFVFNRALALQNENHEAGNKYIPYGKMASWLVEWKNATETQWLKDSPSQPLQQSLKDPERAYKNFFRLRHHAQMVCFLSRP